MRTIRALLIFHRKLIIPTLALSLLAGYSNVIINGAFSFLSVGVSYPIFGLLMHYFIYEVRNNNEYYFYFNMGFNRLSLWVSTFILSLPIAAIFTLLVIL